MRVAGAIAASTFAAGAFFGFPSIADHLSFWIFAGTLLVVSARIAEALCPACDPADATIRLGIAAFGLVVLLGLLLGATHLLARLPYLAVQALLMLGAWRWLPGGRTRWSNGENAGPALLLALTGVMTAFVIGTGLSHSPFTAYDSLSYHLFFPARWLQAHRLSIIPTPFSDEAQAYQPANGELWFLWLMLPFHGDLLARIGQVPFYLLAAMAAYALARRMGATPPHALYAPVFVLIAPPVVEQAVGANVDLIFAATFLTSLYLGTSAVDSNASTDWAAFGASAGLFLGTKYLALVYLPIFLALPFIRGLRPRAIGALPGIAVFAMFWYLRNWVVAGSPIYPATLAMAGLTIGRGAYSRGAMLQSFMRTSNPRLLAVSLVHAFGAPLFVVVLPAMVIVLAAVVRRRAWWPAGFVLLVPPAVALLCWWQVGDNTDSRFLLPAVVTTMALMPLAFGNDRRANAAIHGLFALGIAWVLVGVDRQSQPSVPWFMADWLSWRGVIRPEYVTPFLAGVGVAWLAWRVVEREWATAVAAGLACAGGVVLAIGAETWCVPSRCDFVQVSSPHLRQTFLYGTRWLTANASGANVAYAGINLPYPLSGSHLSNVVYYVNIDRHADWRFDDYARAFRRRRPSVQALQGIQGLQPEAAPLATASGLMMPASATNQSEGGALDAMRPRFERVSGNADAWVANLRARGVGWLFVSTLDPYEIDYVWHNAQGFPIEDEWAKADPRAFRLAYENPDVRIYQVTLP